MSAPYFPPPGDKPPAEPAPEHEEPAPPPRVVVNRAEPPRDLADGPGGRRGAPNALTPEEIQALLATTKVNVRRDWSRSRRRLAVMVPVALLGAILEAETSSAVATAIVIVVSLGVLGWTVRPLFNQRGWD